MADTLDLKSNDRKVVRVRPPLPAPRSDFYTSKIDDYSLVSLYEREAINYKKFSLLTKLNGFYLGLAGLSGYAFLLATANSQAFKFAHTMDSYRDYMIGHLMLREGSFIPLGPYNSAFGEFSSPLYYYLIRAILAIRDNYEFLTAFNIVLQIVVIGIMILTLRKLFNWVTALGAGAILIFNYPFFDITEHLWQPSMLFPFLSAALICLAWGYIRKSFWLLLGGVSLAATSVVVYNASAPIFPVILAGALFVMKKFSLRKPGYLLLLIPVLVVVISYLPALNYFQSQPGAPSLMDIGKHGLGLNLSNWSGIKFLSQLNFNFFDYPRPNEIILLSKIMGVVIAGLGLKYFFSSKVPRESKQVSGFLLVVLLSVLIAPFFDASTVIERHFYSLLIPVSILIAEFFSSSITNKFLRFPVSAILIFAVLQVTNGNQRPLLIQDIYNLNFAETYHPVGPAMQAVKNEILQIRSEAGYPDLNFFQIKDQLLPHASTDIFTYYPLYWMSLEDSLGTKLVRLDMSQKYFRFSSKNTDNYLFVVCDFLVLRESFSSCLDLIGTENPKFRVTKKVFSQIYYSIYLLKKNSS